MFSLLLIVIITAPSVGEYHWKYGEASWYRPKTKHVREWGKVKGKILLAAHPRLRAGGLVLVEDVHTHRSVIVRICGRGPHARGRVIDLSRDAFSVIASRSGVTDVRLRVICYSHKGCGHLIGAMKQLQSSL